MLLKQTFLWTWHSVKASLLVSVVQSQAKHHGGLRAQALTELSVSVSVSNAEPAKHHGGLRAQALTDSCDGLLWLNWCLSKTDSQSKVLFCQSDVSFDLNNWHYEQGLLWTTFLYMVVSCALICQVICVWPLLHEYTQWLFQVTVGSITKSIFIFDLVDQVFVMLIIVFCPCLLPIYASKCFIVQQFVVMIKVCPNFCLCKRYFDSNKFYSMKL